MYDEDEGRYGWTDKIPVSTLIASIAVRVGQLQVLYEKQLAVVATWSTEDQNHHMVHNWRQECQNLISDLSAWLDFLGMRDPDQILTVKFADFDYFTHSTLPLLLYVPSQNEKPKHPSRGKKRAMVVEDEGVAVE